MRWLLALLLVTTAWAGESTMPAERLFASRRGATLSGKCIAVNKPACANASTSADALAQPGKSSGWLAAAYGTGVNGFMEFVRGRGTVDAPTAVQSGDTLGSYSACGHDGVTVCGVFGLGDASIIYKADGTFTTSSHPTTMEVNVTPSGSTTPAKALAIRQDKTIEAVKTVAVYNNVATADNSATSMPVLNGPAPITASSSAISNTVTETVFSNGTYNVAANTLTAGRTFRVQAWGQMGSTTTGPQVNLRLRWGANGAPVNTDPLLIDLQGTEGISVTAKGWFATFVATCRTTGASGTVDGNGMGVIPNSVALNDAQVATTTVDTTAAKTLALFVKFGAAAVADTITLEGFTVEWLN